MDDVARTRRATHDAVRDITPEALRAVIHDRLDDASMIPGVLTVLSARAVTAPDGGAVAPRPAPEGEEREAGERPVERRAAGVQLIYEGLHLTRDIVRDDPWTADAPPNVPADVDVLAADVLVARGFRLLARTEGAQKAVETVRAFGRHETDAEAGRDPSANGLEADVFELAAIAGATTGGGEPPLALRQYVTGLAHAHGAREAAGGHGNGRGLPPAAGGLPETVEEVMRRVSATVEGVEGARPRSAGSVNRND